MLPEKINTAILHQFINQVKGAESSNQREIRLDIATAKNISHTLSLVMLRLIGNYETLITEKEKEQEVINVQMDGGSWDKK